jgi:hypothetical protein
MQGLHFPIMLEVSGAAWIVVLVVLVILAVAAIRNVARLRFFGGRGQFNLEPSDERYIHGRVASISRDSLDRLARNLDSDEDILMLQPICRKPVFVIRPFLSSWLALPGRSFQRYSTERELIEPEHAGPLRSPPQCRDRIREECFREPFFVCKEIRAPINCFDGTLRLSGFHEVGGRFNGRLDVYFGCAARNLRA